MRTITEKLNNGELVLLDGGVSTEIQKCGVALDQEAWSGIAHRTHPQVVRQVHENYIRAGAQVITTNTFSTAKHVLDSVNLGSESVQINREAVQIAKQARDNAATEDVWIAGAISSTPGINNPREIASNQQAKQNYNEMAETFAEAGVDLIIAEMMLDTTNATLVIEAIKSTGLPAWIGFSTKMAADEKTVLAWRDGREGDASEQLFADLIDSIAHLGGDAAGVMHTSVEDTAAGLDVLNKHWSGTKLVYAETGRLEKPDWVFEEICTPNDYATHVKRWINDYNIQIIGGCCGTGPEHIKRLKEQLID